MGENDSLTVAHVTVVTEEGIIEDGYLHVKAGRIVSYGPMAEGLPSTDAEKLMLTPEHRVLPGMIDVHIHGAEGADTMDASRESLNTMARALPREGTTSFLATTITQSPEAIDNALAATSKWIRFGPQSGQAECLGIHLEGPFISPERAGAQPVAYICHPNVEQFMRWQQIAGGHIRLVTLAPEEPGGLELVRHLQQTGVIASVGHSDAVYEQVVEAIEAGASHVTHLYNGMRGFHHREPGVVGASFLRKELQVEVIADGIHSGRESLRLAYEQIGPERLLLITDSMRAKCLKAGTYDLGGQQVTVSGREARLVDGTLAGSILYMNEGAKMIRDVTGCGWEEVVQITASNAARELGVYDRKGSIAVGKDADIVVLDPAGEVCLTLCRGEVAYRNGGL